MRRVAPLAVVTLLAVLLARTAPADDAPPATAASAAPTTAPADSSAPAADTTPKNLTGYGYRDHAPPKGHWTPRKVTHVAAVPAGPIATLPGFEMLADGSSRFFVQLTQAVQVEEKKAAGTVTYVLKGAHVTMRNNENALVTVHFNTPVTSARLTPVHEGLAFVISLRANVAPTYKVVAAKEGSSILEVDFAKGSYVPSGDAAPAQPVPVDGHR